MYLHKRKQIKKTFIKFGKEVHNCWHKEEKRHLSTTLKPEDFYKSFLNPEIEMKD